MKVKFHKLCIVNDTLKDKISILTFIHEYLSNVKDDEDITKEKCMEYVMRKGRGSFIPDMVSDEIKIIMQELGV